MLVVWRLLDDEGPGLESLDVEECAIFSLEALSVQGLFLASELARGEFPPESVAEELAEGPEGAFFAVDEELLEHVAVEVLFFLGRMVIFAKCLAPGPATRTAMRGKGRQATSGFKGSTLELASADGVSPFASSPFSRISHSVAFFSKIPSWTTVELR